MERPVTDTPPTPESRLAEIKARTDAATPGPWLHYSSAQTNEVHTDPKRPVAAWMGFDGTRNAKANARFIAHARSDIPWLLSEVARLRADSARDTQRLDELEELRRSGRLQLFRLQPSVVGVALPPMADAPVVVYENFRGAADASLSPSDTPKQEANQTLAK
jgi:hypothetical protein